MRRALMIAVVMAMAGCGDAAPPREPAGGDTGIAPPANGDTGAPAPPDGGLRAGHGGDLEAQFARTVRGRVVVPARDVTPPRALLELDSGAGKPVVHDDPVRPRRGPWVDLARPEFEATALIRDADGGTARIRVSVVYVTRCDGVERQHGEYFPPAQVANVRIAPGVRVPVQRERSARVRFPAGCEVSGKVFAEATNAHGLESFSDPIWFRF